MSQPLVYIDTSDVREGALEELKSAIGELSDFVESHEPQVVSYAVYFSQDDSQMTVIHVHRDSASLDVMNGRASWAVRCPGGMPGRWGQTLDRGGPPMNSVGIDLHRSRSYVAVIDEHGELSLSRRIANHPDTVLELLDELEGETQIAVEATYGWEWLAELLEDAGYELHLAHPLRTKAIASARVKTDAVDARTLAHLLRADLLPEAYVAPRELRDLRDLLRQRVVITQMHTALKNRVHALIARQGVERQHAALFGSGGKALLDQLPLRPQPRRRLEVLLRLITDFDREIDALANEIDRRAKHDPRVEVLTQIRGIGRYIAMLVIAAVGEVERFPSARHLCAWAGLTPTVSSCDGKARLGHISRLGSSTLRWALVEAAQHTTRGGGPLRESFEQIAKRRGRQLAKVAIARKMLTLCYYGLRDGEIRCLSVPDRRARSKSWRPLKRESSPT